MSIIPPTMSGEKKTAVVAIAASLIGISLIVALLTAELIGEAAFSALFTVVLLVCLFIAFSNRVESISLKELTINLAKVQEIQQTIVAKDLEPKPSIIYANGTIGGFKTSMEAYGIDEEAKGLIKAIGKSQYTFRYIESLVADSGLSIDIVKDKLNWLIINGLAIEYGGIDGKVYALSPKGQSVFSGIVNQP